MQPLIPIIVCWVIALVGLILAVIALRARNAPPPILAGTFLCCTFVCTVGATGHSDAGPGNIPNSPWLWPSAVMFGLATLLFIVATYFKRG